MQNITTKIIIDAPIETVWNTLINFEDYPKWNPFIHIKGVAVVGEQLQNTIFLEGQKPQVFKPKVLVVEPKEEFRWEGHLFVKGLFDGNHYFQLTAIEKGKTQLIHGENFKGILSKVILKMIRPQTVAGFKKMNTALKTQCESMVLVA
ncbi:MAG: SRPBCC domain-containing protein [Bacteroidota bacterium]